VAPRLPSEGEAILAKETSRVLARRKTVEPLRARLLDDPETETIELPATRTLRSKAKPKRPDRTDTVSMKPDRFKS
jgi:hypothetical protein